MVVIIGCFLQRYKQENIAYFGPRQCITKKQNSFLKLLLY
nr:MAG TPA_asm: hypothetical protein [Caudoviricetes sp.]